MVILCGHYVFNHAKISQTDLTDADLYLFFNVITDIQTLNFVFK